MPNKNQINIQFPYVWKIKLSKIARKISFETDVDVSYADLIRRAVLNFISGSMETK